MVLLGIVCKIQLKYSKELVDYKVKYTGYNDSWCIKIISLMK